MKIVRWFALAAVLAGITALSPSAGAGVPAPTVPYTCEETTDPAVGVPQLAVPLGISVSDTPDPAKIFQTVTWTADLETPDLGSPLTVAMHYLRVRLAIPDGLTGVRAAVVAPPGETPNPPLSQITVQVAADEVVVQLPGSPDPSRRILVASEGQGGALTYPFVEGTFNVGTAVVLPRIQVTALPTPAVSGQTIEWSAPEIDAAATIPLSGNPTGTLTCVADGVSPPVVASTAVTTTRQLCDGLPVTVQLGFTAPTAGADVIQGTPADDTTNGLGGNDRFCGLTGVDTFNGGGGNDRALGGAGNDRLRGDAGDDRLLGDAGDDNLQGGANRDALIGGANRDTCNGGPQTDTATTCEVRQSIP